MTPLFKFFHLIGVVIWVGGMFFAWMCLRPVAAKNLEPPVRLKLWADVFSRFFPWVWASSLSTVSSGAVTIFSIGFKHAPLHWHVMLLIGIAMFAIFAYVSLGLFKSLRSAVAEQNWVAGGKALGQIRKLVGLNLMLGIATILIATVGRLLA